MDSDMNLVMYDKHDSQKKKKKNILSKQPYVKWKEIIFEIDNIHMLNH